MKTFIIILLIGILILYLYLFLHNRLKFKENTITIITGAPKTGKSLLAVYKTITKYKSKCFKVKLKNFFYKITFQKQREEIGYIYSNTPLNVDYIPLTKEYLTREKRIKNNSVVYIGEFSLVANSRLGQRYGIKNGVDYDEINEQLLFFMKLFGRETKNSNMYIDTQTIQDVHYNVKRCLSEYYYITTNTKIPFFVILHVKNLIYSEDNSNINMNDVRETQDTGQWIIIPKSYYKKYDYRCLSILTDNNPTTEENELKKGKKKKSLKQKYIVSFNEYKTIKEYEEKQLRKEIKNVTKN